MSFNHHLGANLSINLASRQSLTTTQPEGGSAAVPETEKLSRKKKNKNYIFLGMNDIISGIMAMENGWFFFSSDYKWVCLGLQLTPISSVNFTLLITGFWGRSPCSLHQPCKPSSTTTWNERAVSVGRNLGLFSHDLSREKFPSHHYLRKLGQPMDAVNQQNSLCEDLESVRSSQVRTPIYLPVHCNIVVYDIWNRRCGIPVSLNVRPPISKLWKIWVKLEIFRTWRINHYKLKDSTFEST